jgi:hypothetical protein
VTGWALVAAGHRTAGLVQLRSVSSCVLYGFLNIAFSLGPALLLAAAWLRCRERFPIATIVTAAVGASVLFACHLTGLVFFGPLVGRAEPVRVFGPFCFGK